MFAMPLMQRRGATTNGELVQRDAVEVQIRHSMSRPVGNA